MDPATMRRQHDAAVQRENAMRPTADEFIAQYQRGLMLLAELIQALAEIELRRPR